MGRQRQDEERALIRLDVLSPLPKYQQIVEQVDKESLTPVVRWLVFRDLPSIFSPYEVGDDRGRVLERTWEANTGGALARRRKAAAPSASASAAIPQLLV